MPLPQIIEVIEIDVSMNNNILTHRKKGVPSLS